MYLKRVLLFCIIFARTSFGIQNRYCQLSCDFNTKTVTHTVCDRQDEKCSPSANCGPDVKVLPMSDHLRQYILDLHNFLRNKVAMGNESRGNQPSATNIKAMRYDKELEFIAQCWANTCNGRPLIHDSCRRTAAYEHVGQNLGIVNSSANNLKLKAVIKKIIMLWYDEVAIFKSEWVRNTQDRGPKVKVGHYTQMLWANSSEVGCGATYYTAQHSGRNWHQILLVCNYGPGGNYLGTPMYEIGPPASNCDSNLKRNEFYQGLCGESTRVEQERPAENIFEL